MGIIWSCCGYKLKVPYSIMSTTDFYRFHACVYLVENQQSLMQIERNPKWEIPHSTLHRWIRTKLKDISPELYSNVRKQFEINLKRRNRNEKK